MDFLPCSKHCANINISGGDQDLVILRMGGTGSRAYYRHCQGKEQRGVGAGGTRFNLSAHMKWKEVDAYSRGSVIRLRQSQGSLEGSVLANIVPG